jgi:hypothetical protein
MIYWEALSTQASLRVIHEYYGGILRTVNKLATPFLMAVLMTEWSD